MIASAIAAPRRAGPARSSQGSPASTSWKTTLKARIAVSHDELAIADKEIGAEITALRVRVPMMQVGIVRVPMYHRHMLVGVRMSPVHSFVGRMLVLMMFVVSMTMLMLERLVCMLMTVSFCEMQVETNPHQAACHEQPPGDGVVEQRYA